MTEIKNNEWDGQVAFSRKYLESVVFVEEEFLHKKIQKKEDGFEDLTAKHTERKQGSVKQYGVCAGYKVTEMFDKAFSWYLKSILAWFLPSIL